MSLPHCATVMTASGLVVSIDASDVPSPVVLPVNSDFLIDDDAGSAVAERLAAEAVGGEHQRLFRRRFRHEADVGDDDDGVGAVRRIDGFDEIRAGAREIERQAAAFGVLRRAAAFRATTPRAATG